MKKVIKVKDPDSGKTICVTVTNEPLDTVDLVENAIKGYITSLRDNVAFTPEAQLTRNVAKGVAKTALPAKYTTTIRE